MTLKKKRRKKKKRYHTGSFLSKKTGQICKYRSGWELAYLEYLDSNNDVETFQYESLKIPYISNKRTNKIRHYTPDVLVEYNDGKKELVEIKPLRKLSQPAVAKKLAAASEWCSAHGVTLKTLTEVELRQLGLIK